jgi:hypothetical protein
VLKIADRIAGGIMFRLIAAIAIVAASSLALSAETAKAGVNWGDGVTSGVSDVTCHPNGQYINFFVYSQRYPYAILGDNEPTYVRIWSSDRYGSRWIDGPGVKMGPNWFPIPTGWFNYLFQARFSGQPTRRDISIQYYRWVNGAWSFWEERPVITCYL